MLKKLCMVAACLFLACSTSVCAAAADAETLIVEGAKAMEGVMQVSYNNAKERFAADIAKEGADYGLSMESFTEGGSPYRNFDYRKFIAYYVTVQEYCRKNGIAMEGGTDAVEFIKYSYEVCEAEEYAPTRVDTYEEENGRWVKSGRRYILVPEEAEIFTETSDGYYEKTGTQVITPDIESVKYLDADVYTIDPDDIFAMFGADKKEVIEKAKKRLAMFNVILNHIEIGQNVFIGKRGITQAQAEELQEAVNAVSGNRQSLLITAASLVGQVPYEWGGKSVKAGYDNTWWTFGENGSQKGLDCSGYVQWVFRTAGFGIWEQLGSTSQILAASCLEEIPQEELEPGDIGILNRGEEVNHTGIYIGNGYFLHCSSSAGTVTASKFAFRYFYRVKGFDGMETEEPALGVEEKVPDAYSLADVSEEEYYIAKFVQAEAQNEGMNGWVAVAEVIKNRMASDRFSAGTLRDVVDEPGQFASWKKVQSMQSVDEDILRVTKETLDGNLAVFNNPDVLFFQNPEITGKDEEEFNGCPLYMRIGNHCFYTVGDG